MTETDTSDTLVQSVSRALEILNFLTDNSDGVALSKVCEGTLLNMSTAHRLLGTLIAHGYVRQEPATKEYFLGPQSLRLAHTALAQFDIRNEAIGPLRQLASEARELANMAVLNADYAIYILQVPAEERTIQMFTQIGARVPLHCSGVGKAMLAYMPEMRVQQILGDKALPAFTVNTITNMLRLRQELATVRECGYAVDDEEREEGVRCVSAPVFQADGQVRAAVSISGPSGRFPHARLHELGLRVRDAGLEISANLGYRPNSD